MSRAIASFRWAVRCRVGLTVGEEVRDTKRAPMLQFTVRFVSRLIRSLGRNTETCYSFASAKPMLTSCYVRIEDAFSEPSRP